MTDTTDIQIYDPGQPLRHARNVDLMLVDKRPLAALNRAWPGDDLDPNLRFHKTKQFLEQAKNHILMSKVQDKIQACGMLSVVDSLVACAGMDLSLNRAMGEAYLVPFKDVCTLMVGYKGFIKLIVNTGFVTHLESVLVYEGEPFTWRRTEEGPQWEHKPDLEMQGKGDKVVACYAVGYTREGPPMFEVMNLEQLKKIKGSSKAVQSGKKGPYDWWETEMFRKAPIRRLQKWLPKTGDSAMVEILTRALEHDNKMFDLNARGKYIEAGDDYRKREQARKEKDWHDRVAAKPVTAETPEPSSTKTAEPKQAKKPELADDGAVIPEGVGQEQDDG